MIIGIGGVNMSGKSSLARLLKNQFPNKKVAILCQDDYIKSRKEIPKINGNTDWERPESIDFDSYIAAVMTCSVKNDVVISEGLLSFFDHTLVKLYDKKIFIQIPKTIFLERKQKDTRWNMEPLWYIEHIWQSYKNYGRLLKYEGEVFMMDGNKPVDMSGILRYIKN